MPAPRYVYPQKPRRDTYLFVIGIIAFAAPMIVLLTGMVCALIALIEAIIPSESVKASAQFSGVVLFVALATAGLVGGGFSCYHSARSLFWRKPSASLKLPTFWIFFGAYIILVTIGFIIRDNNDTFAIQPLIVSLIMLAGLLPALAVFSLAVRRLRKRSDVTRATTWRRFTLSIVSGATFGILIALILELILTLVAAVEFRLSLSSLFLTDPNAPLPTDPTGIIFTFFLASVIAPLVEEAVKPLAVVVLIRRINSAAEAFILGMACGIGFDLVETSSYISQGYHNWLDIALERSSAGLLHGFGAGMVALGWYFLTHRDSIRNHIWVGIGCGAYAVLQHAIWNGSSMLALLPDPVGPYLDSGVITIGSYPMPSLLLVYIAETILMLVFFFYVTRQLRKLTVRKAAENSTQNKQEVPVEVDSSAAHGA